MPLTIHSRSWMGRVVVVLPTLCPGVVVFSLQVICPPVTFLATCRVATSALLSHHGWALCDNGNGQSWAHTISILVLYCCMMNYQNLVVETTKMYYLTISLGQSSRHGIAWFSAQGLTGMQSVSASAAVLIWASGFSSKFMITGRTHHLELARLTSPFLYSLSGRGHSLEATHSPCLLAPLSSSQQACFRSFSCFGSLTSFSPTGKHPLLLKGSRDLVRPIQKNLPILWTYNLNMGVYSILFIGIVQGVYSRAGNLGNVRIF